MSDNSFVSIGQRISLSRAASTKSASPAPLIVICTWMGAADKHIAVYTKEYRRRFPSSHLLLIRASVGDVYSSHAQHAVRLAPAMDTLRSLVATSGSSDPPVFVHAFSNGGSMMAVHLAINLRKTAAATTNNSSSAWKASSAAADGHFHRVILDCTPSRPRVGESARAMTVAIPTAFFARALAELVGWVLFALWLVVERAIGRENAVLTLRKRVNEPGLLQGVGAGAQRLYLYSKADRMIGWKDVRDHVAEAKGAAMGLARVQEVVFTKAPHCALPREDGEKYWGAIEGFLGGKS